MKERLARDENFYRLTGIDTSHPNWQIESLSDEGLDGFIIDTNIRIGIHDEEAVKSFLSEYPATTMRGKPKSFESMLSTVKNLANSALSAQENYPDAPRYQGIFQDTAHRNIAGWISQNPKIDSPLKEATVISLISASYDFRWSENRRKLTEFSESVSLLSTAYEEKAKRLEKGNG